MTGDWVFDLCLLAIGVSIMATGVLFGFLWGNHTGVKAVKQELLENGWQYLEQKR